MQTKKELLEQARAQNIKQDESDTFKKLQRSERETHYSIADDEDYWQVDVSIQKDINRLIKCNWILVDTTYYPDGTVMAKRFKAPRNCLAPRTYVKDKPKRERAPMSDELKQKLAEGRQKKKENNQNNS